MADIKLTQLIDSVTLQSIQDGFSNSTGMTALIVDSDGIITHAGGTAEMCYNASQRKASGVKSTGLFDYSAPVLLDGQEIAYVIGGMALTEIPDDNAALDIAGQLGLGIDVYKKILKSVTVMPSKRIDACVDFLHTIADTIASLAYVSYMSESKNKTNTDDDKEKVMRGIYSAEVLAKESSRSFSILNDRFSRLSDAAKRSSEVVRDTSETIKNIQNVALNTRILGFNASIEASRAKESGKGFGVIAQEVRNLADVSNASANKVEETISSISEFTDEINNIVSEMDEMIGKNAENIKKIDAFLSELKVAASKAGK